MTTVAYLIDVGILLNGEMCQCASKGRSRSENSTFLRESRGWALVLSLAFLHPVWTYEVNSTSFTQTFEKLMNKQLRAVTSDALCMLRMIPDR